MFQERGDNIDTHEHTHTHALNRKIQVSPHDHCSHIPNGVHVSSRRLNAKEQRWVSVMIAECLTSTPSVRHKTCQLICLHIHSCEDTVSHPTAASVCVYMCVCVGHSRRGAEQTNPHATQCTTQTALRLPGAKLTRLPEGTEREEECWLQSINHSCMLLWYQQSPHYPLHLLAHPMSVE